MRKQYLILGLLAILVSMAGCPMGGGSKYTFTSADLRGGRLFDNVLGGGVPTDAPEGGEVTPREVIEPDVIRRDGNLLYILNQYRGLSIVDLDDQTVLCQVPTYGFPRDLYLDGDRAYVLVSYASDYHADGNTVRYDVASRLYVVDVSDTANASIVNTFELSGDLVDSRLVGDVLYAVGAEFQWYWAEGNVAKAQTSGTWVTSVNLADENNIYEADEESFDHAGTVIHVTDQALIVAAPDWNGDTTHITYVDIADPSGLMEIRGAIDVTGHVADKFKLDIWNGVLRIVSNAWDDERRVYITTIDLADPDALAFLAETHLDRAQGDTLFATRFDGPRAYIVTFFVVDPLFVVDLADPANPQVLGELEVPGWSTYIHPMGDRLITLGVDNTDGWKVSLSLFNVADPANPGLIERISFGKGWSWSSAYDDVKALSVFDDLLIVPFSGWEEESGGFDRLQFVSYTPDDLSKRGSVDVRGTVLRSFEYAKSYFAVTSEQLAMIDGSNPDSPVVTGSTVLAEHVADFLELAPGIGVEIVTQYDTGDTIVRARDLPLKSAGSEAVLSIGELVGAHVYGTQVILVGSVWDPEPGYRVAAVDFVDPPNPEVVEIVDVDVWPYFGYWWIMPYLPLIDGSGSGAAEAADVAGSSLLWPWLPPLQRETTFVLGDVLALRCGADDFDHVIGSVAPTEGLALIQLDTLEWSDTVGLGYSRVAGVHSDGNALFISSCESVPNASPFEGPLCAYFVTRFDPDTLQAGPDVNVPGAFVQYDGTNGVLTLRDDQWRADSSSRSLLRTVLWNGSNQVQEADSATLPEGTAAMLGRGAKVYFDGYDEGTTLNAASISPAGAITLGVPVLVTDEWAYLIDAQGTSAYMSVGGGAIARYSFTGAPRLKELKEIMGSPWRMRFGSAAAYAPLGYFGVEQLGL